MTYGRAKIFGINEEYMAVCIGSSGERYNNKFTKDIIAFQVSLKDMKDFGVTDTLKGKIGERDLFECSLISANGDGLEIPKDSKFFDNILKRLKKVVSV